MAEGIARPTAPETWLAFSKRLAAAECTTFEVARGLSLALEEDWKRGIGSEPASHFSVRVRGDLIALTRLSNRARGWHVLVALAKRGEFGGRKLEVSDG